MKTPLLHCHRKRFVTTKLTANYVQGDRRKFSFPAFSLLLVTWSARRGDGTRKRAALGPRMSRGLKFFLKKIVFFVPTSVKQLWNFEVLSKNQNAVLTFPQTIGKSVSRKAPFLKRLYHETCTLENSWNSVPLCLIRRRGWILDCVSCARD